MKAIRFSVVCLILLAALPLAARLEAAQSTRKKDAAQVNQAKGQFEDANDQVKQAHQKLDASRKELAQAQNAQEASTAKAQKALQSAVREHGAKLGLPQAVADMQSAQREADSIKSLIVTALKGEADYQRAAKAAGEASDQLKAVRDDASLSADERQRKSSQLSAVIRRPIEMERERLSADASYQAALRKYNDARKKGQRLEQRAQKEAEADPDVQKAEADAKKAQDEAKKTQKDISQRQKELAAAQSKAAQEQKQYQQAVNKEKQDEARAKSKKKKKNN